MSPTQNFQPILKPIMRDVTARTPAIIGGQATAWNSRKPTASRTGLIIDFALFSWCSHSNPPHFREQRRMIGFKIGWKFWVGLIVLLLGARMPWFIHNNYQLQVLFRITLFLRWDSPGTWWAVTLDSSRSGHVAFFGVGALRAGALAELGIPVWISAFLAALVATAFAAIIGTIAFRLRGPTHACHHCFCRSFALGRYQSQCYRRSHWLDHARPLCWQGFLAIFLSRRGSVGRGFILNELLGLALPLRLLPDGDPLKMKTTAAAVGINTARCKVYALLMSAFLTALGGALYVVALFSSLFRTAF